MQVCGCVGREKEEHYRISKRKRKRETEEYRGIQRNTDSCYCFYTITSAGPVRLCLVLWGAMGQFGSVLDRLCCARVSFGLTDSLLSDRLESDCVRLGSDKKKSQTVFGPKNPCTSRKNLHMNNSE